MVNTVVLVGNLGRDPEVFQTQAGRSVARLSIATNETWTKGGERQRHTEWHRVVVWGPRAERIGAQLQKGALVYVEGRLRSRTTTGGDTPGQILTEVHAQRLLPLKRRTPRDVEGATEQADGAEGYRDDEVPF